MATPEPNVQQTLTSASQPEVKLEKPRKGAKRPAETTSAMVSVDRPAVISAEEYNAIISTLRPLSIDLAECSFVRQPGTELIRSDLGAKAEQTAPELKGTQRFSEIFITTITQSSDFTIETGEGLPIAKGVAKFIVRIETHVEPRPEFWSIFLKRNIRMYVQPPLRDLIASLAARSGLICAPLASVMVTPNIPTNAHPKS